MKPHVLLMTIAALAGLYILDAPTAQAADLFRTDAIAVDWDDFNDWVIYDEASHGFIEAVAGQFPEAGDTAIILPTHTATLVDAEDECAGFLVIMPDGMVVTNGNTLTIDGEGGLFIESGGLLNVNADTGTVDLTVDGTYVIDGELRLSHAGAVLEISADVVLGGAGRIYGTATGAEISVDGGTPGKTLTSQIRIEGIVTIAGTADAITGFFYNEGWVVADSASASILLEDLTFRGCGQWRVGPTSGTEIEFASTAKATQLCGCFLVFDGTLDIDANVLTSGHLTWVDGQIIVASGVEFRPN